MATLIAKDYGLDLSAHRAQQITGWMCTHADLILVMEFEHRLELERLYPLARGKIHQLGEFGREAPFDIQDPYTRPRAAFEVAHADITLGVDQWAQRILRIA
jgi:protein-tyrosine phosphatase